MITREAQIKIEIKKGRKTLEEGYRRAKAAILLKHNLQPNKLKEATDYLDHLHGIALSILEGSLTTVGTHIMDGGVGRALALEKQCTVICSSLIKRYEEGQEILELERNLELERKKSTLLESEQRKSTLLESEQRKLIQCYDTDTVLIRLQKHIRYYEWLTQNASSTENKELLVALKKLASEVTGAIEGKMEYDCNKTPEGKVAVAAIDLLATLNTEYPKMITIDPAQGKKSNSLQTNQKSMTKCETAIKQYQQTCRKATNKFSPLAKTALTIGLIAGCMLVGAAFGVIADIAVCGVSGGAFTVGGAMLGGYFGAMAGTAIFGLPAMSILKNSLFQKSPLVAPYKAVETGARNLLSSK